MTARQHTPAEIRAAVLTALRGYDIDRPTYVIRNHIRMNDWARWTHLTTGHVRTALARLERDWLVKSGACSRGYHTTWQLTDAGRTAIKNQIAQEEGR